MATVTKFEFKGFKELYKTLDKIPEGVKSKELQPILELALEPIRGFAEVMAPDDLKTSGPDLHKSIIISGKQRSGRAKRDRPLGRFDARAYVGPTPAGYPQAIFMEFGTGPRHWEAPGPTKYVGVATAQPYMRPAWDSQKQVSLEFLKKHFAEHVTNIAERYRSFTSGS